MPLHSFLGPSSPGTYCVGGLVCAALTGAANEVVVVEGESKTRAAGAFLGSSRFKRYPSLRNPTDYVQPI